MNRAPWLLLLLAGCGITETGNPELDAELTLRAVSSAPTQVDVRPVEVGVTGVESAWLSVERLEFTYGERCDEGREREYELDEPFVTDAASVVPDTQSLLLFSSEYCRVRLRLRPAASSAGPADLSGHSLLLTGTLADGTPYLVRSTEDFRLEVRSAIPVPLDEISRSMLISLDVAVWLDGIDLSTATREDDASIRIEPGSNAALLAQIEARIEAAMELFDDDDGDGELDEDDDD